MTIISVVVWIATAATIAWWIVRTWSSADKKYAAVNRAQLVTAGIDALVMMALIRAIAPPPPQWWWLWLLAGACVGIGLAGTIRRWPGLPWTTSRHARRSAVGAVTHTVLGVALLAVLS